MIAGYVFAAWNDHGIGVIEIFGFTHDPKAHMQKAAVSTLFPEMEEVSWNMIAGVLHRFPSRVAFACAGSPITSAIADRSLSFFFELRTATRKYCRSKSLSLSQLVPG